MKTREIANRVPALALAIGWLPVVLAQEQVPEFPLDSQPADTSVKRDQTAPAPQSSPSVAPGAAKAPASTADAPAPDSSRPRPPPLLSPWAKEIAKLADAGIEDFIIRSFIDNAGTFNLGADQIVHLRARGVSGEIIAAMLQHDQEVISGARPLTLSSEPDWEPTPLPTRTPVRQAPRAATPAPASASAPKLSMKTELPATSCLGSPPIEVVKAADAVTQASPAATTSVFLNGKRAAVRQEPLYRVREPHPVPLTAPIVFVPAAEPVPNTLVIEWFPQAER